MSIPEFAALYWKSDAGELLVGGLTVSSLAKKHGTPLFLYDREVIETKYSALRKTLPGKFSISYSMKANPHPAFLQLFLEKGCGLEVASGGELQQAQYAGCPATKILFAGPGKTEDELRLAISKGIGEIHAESQLEIERISAVSKEYGTVTSVAVRVNPNEQGQGGAMRMGGKAAPFGVDEESLGPLLRQIVDDPHLDFAGVHVFLGTQILDHEVLASQYRKAIGIGRYVADVTGSPLRTLDFGGGLGTPYFHGDSELNLDALETQLRALVDEIALEECFANTTFVVEPGRFLVAEAGVYVARVNDIKISRGKKYLILDGGMNHHLAASGNLGQVIKRNFPMAVANRIDSPSIESVEIVGPLCTPLDTLARSQPAPAVSVGDLVAVFQSGAYARTASPLGFLGHPTPPEVWVENGNDFLIRRRGIFEDYLRDLPAAALVLQSDC